MATPQVKDLVLRSPAGSNEVLTFPWPLQVGSGQDRHDNGIDIIDTIKFVCDELPSISSAFEEINLYKIDTACYKTMTNLVDRFNKAVDSIVALVSKKRKEVRKCLQLSFFSLFCFVFLLFFAGERYITACRTPE